MQTSLLAFGRLVGAGSASSWEMEERKAQVKKGTGDVLFFPAAAAASEKESGPCESMGEWLQPPSCTRTARDRCFKDGTH